MNYTMKKRLRVLLCGDTLALAGLRASLATYKSLDVADFSGQVPSAEALLSQLPDVVIYDAEAVERELCYTLMETLPELLLVSIDVSRDRLLMWSGQQLGELSTNDLVQVIGHLSS